MHTDQSVAISFWLFTPHSWKLLLQTSWSGAAAFCGVHSRNSWSATFIESPPRHSCTSLITTLLQIVVSQPSFSRSSEPCHSIEASAIKFHSCSHTCKQKHQSSNISSASVGTAALYDRPSRKTPLFSTSTVAQYGGSRGHHPFTSSNSSLIATFFRPCNIKYVIQ